MTTLAHSTRGILAVTRCRVAELAQYRVNLAIWAIASVLQVVVYMAVWRAVADASGGAVGGYDAAGFAGYFLVLLVVRELTMTWMPWDFPEYVRSGKLSPMLLRPLHPLLTIAARMLAGRLRSMAVAAPIGAVLFVLFDARVDPSVGAVLVALLVLPLAATTRFLVDSLVALTSMWLVRIDGIRGIYYLALLLLGGQFAPLDVLPGWLQSIAYALPFYWTLGYPTELLVGRAEVGDAWIALLVLAGWTTAGYALLQPIWRAGTRAYEAVGS